MSPTRLAIILLLGGLLPAVAPATASPPATSRPNQTVLRVQGPLGANITVYVNGRQVPRSGGAQLPWTDISTLVKPGENSIRVVYPVERYVTAATVTVSRAERPGQYRRLTELQVRETGPSGQTFTLVLPAAGDPGRAPTAGSSAGQTVVRLEGASGLFGRPKLKLTLNGRDLGDLGGDNLDISNLVRRGENVLRAEWTSKGAPAGFSLKVAHAEPKNQFKDVATLTVDLTDPGAGQRDLRFTLP